MSRTHQLDLFEGAPDRCSLILYDNSVLMLPFRPWMAEVCAFDEKKLLEVLNEEGRVVGRKVIREEKPFFEILTDTAGVRALHTYPGMWARLLDAAKQRSVEVKYFDSRLDFPSPRFDLMHGFRGTQEPMLRTALEQDRSGLICAPTRYGKSALIINTLRAYPDVRTVVLMPGVELMDQQVAAFKAALPGRSICHMGGKRGAKFQNDDITLCLMDDVVLARLDHKGTRLVLIDEPHALVTDCQLESYRHFEHARKIGYGATLTGRFDQRDILIEAVIGPVLVNKTFAEARDEGAVAPIVVFLLKVPLRENLPLNMNSAYYRALWTNEVLAAHVGRICSDIIPADWQTLLFIANEQSAKFYQDRIVGAEVAMAKLMTDKERRVFQERMTRGESKRTVASNIYSTGVTFSDLRVVFNIAGGGGNTLTVQKPGRVAEIRPGKRCGVVFDFLFEPAPGVSNTGGTRAVVGQSWARHNVYREKDYDVRIVSTMAELRTLFQQLCF
jgi:superfamily II DNA or RNA helicase